ncbi:MAG: HD domain-containing protein, partial [Bacteroidales bacterium]|nr:HD domain-containing protein [Bacteroidales bacterium]
NLGEDTDTTAAVTGGLAGLLYGFDDIPQTWVKQISRHDDIVNLSKRLNLEIEKKTNTDIQTLYQQTIKFAAEHHGNQKIPGSEIPYVVHLSNVCMEILFAATQTKFNLQLAVQVALLHDVLEDTPTTETELEKTFGHDVLVCVKALTKNESLPKAEQMRDSLRRIKQAPKEAWAVKLGDRITNLQPPPKHWTTEKINQYREEAKVIYEELKDGNLYLANRLKAAIDKY